jgi:hypothetical protein
MYLKKNSHQKKKSSKNIFFVLRLKPKLSIYLESAQRVNQFKKTTQDKPINEEIIFSNSNFYVFKFIFLGKKFFFFHFWNYA